MDDQVRTVAIVPASRIEPSEQDIGAMVSPSAGAHVPTTRARENPPPDPGQDPTASRSMLADAVSHELRSTLALISGYSQSLLHLPLDDGTQREYLQRISQAAESLTDLADEVLDLAIVDDGQVLHRQPVSLGWLVERLLGELAGEEGEVVVERRIPAQLPLVHADPVWIAHVLRNLVSNAARYGCDGSRRLRIEAREDGDAVVLTVRDDGAGIDPDERDHVFEAYFRGRRARESSVEGTGLGLYVCRQLIEAHAGRIWLDEVPQGTSVSFSVPRFPADGRAESPLATSPVPVGPSVGRPTDAWRAPNPGGTEPDHGTDRGVLRPVLGAVRPVTG